MTKEKIIIVCGAFDPLDTNDLIFLRGAKKLGNWLIVGLQSDKWCLRNRSILHENFQRRTQILQSIPEVDEVFRFDDSDDTACWLLRQVKIIYHGAEIIYISKKSKDNTPETKIRGIRFGYIGDKAE